MAVFHPGVGAPLAAGMLEEIIALGCRDFIACGGAGVLRSEIAVGHVVIPTSAVRDEGTSYHYLPPSREVAPHPAAVAAIESVLRAHGVAYVTGKTWTTDAIFRETPAKVARRRDEGCLTVEMEAAAFFAVAQFRRVRLAQMLYGGDDSAAKHGARATGTPTTCANSSSGSPPKPASVCCSGGSAGRRAPPSASHPLTPADDHQPIIGNGSWPHFFVASTSDTVASTGRQCAHCWMPISRMPSRC